MQIFEFLLFSVTTLLLFYLSFFGRRRKIQKSLLQLSLTILLVHLLVETARWQMFFVYLLLGVMGLLYFKRSIGYLFFRILGFTLAIAFLGISLFYAITMPVLKLNEPSGQFTVGIREVTIEDSSRNEKHSNDPNEKRKLLLKVWYPGKNPPKGKAQSLWSGLYSGQSDVVSFFTNYLKQVSTHSFPNLEPAKDSYPLILFNHGLQMFAEQNTVLMQHLASHGYIVVSIGHPYESIRVDLGKDEIILPEFISSLDKFQEGMQWIEETSRPILKAREKITFIKDREARAEILMAAIEKAEAINQIVDLWAQDNRFVLNWLFDGTLSKSGAIPKVDSRNIGVMGMSIGGATAAELSKSDKRIKAGVNLDGLHYGTTQKDSLNVPFLMFASDEGAGMNDFLFLRSTSDYFEYHLENSKHADLTDMSIVWPVLRYYGQAGKLDGHRVLTIVNTTILDFWDCYLKGKEGVDMSSSTFSELRVHFRKRKR